MGTLGALRLRVGVFGSKANASHENAGGMTVLELGLVHEFGAPAAGIPQHSYIRAVLDERAGEIRAMQRAAAADVARQRVTAFAALVRIGETVVGWMRERVPVQSGQLRDAITFNVVRAGGAS
jgi:hypothetical protein